MKFKDIINTYRIAAIGVLLALIFVGAAVWRGSVASDVQQEIATKEAEANRLSDNISYRQKLDAQLEQMTALNKRVEERLTQPTDVAGNQQYFYKLESEAGVKITELRQGAKPAGKKPGTPSAYNSAIYNISIEAEYAKAMDFLRRLEAGSRAMRVTSAGIFSAKGAAPAYQLSAPLTLALEVEFLTP